MIFKRKQLKPAEMNPRQIIRELSREHDLRYEDIGRLCGVSKSAISKYASKKPENLRIPLKPVMMHLVALLERKRKTKAEDDIAGR